MTRAPQLRAFPADGFAADWFSWDGADRQSLTLTWDNEAWTARGVVERERVEYVVRLSPLWQVRQFLLFRDEQEPDLWLGTDGRGRWGEVNGAHREDLDGAVAVALAITPFTHTAPVRQLSFLAPGESAELVVAAIDTETLGVVPRKVLYTRADTHRWQCDDTEFTTDEFGVPNDIAAHFRRIT